MAADNRLGWYVGVAQTALLYVTGANQRDFFLDKEVCRFVNDEGRKRLAEIFGDRIRMPGPMCGAISYGHMVSLGAKVHFPDNSEPNVEPMFSSLAEGIRWLKRGENFEGNELFKRYYEIFLYLKDAFPEEKVLFHGFGHQGPITTAVGLRGTDFYMDLLDEPELAKEYLDLLTESTIRFCRLRNRLNGLLPVNPVEGFVTDDLSSLVSPWLWPEFVVPFWDQYYRGLTTGRRGIHVENLVPDHLPHLETAGIEYYDPSVSAKLSPAIIRERINIEFTWRLPAISIPNMTVDGVERWIHDNIRQGARRLHTILNHVYCEPEHRDKATRFMDVCERLEKEYSEKDPAF